MFTWQNTWKEIEEAGAKTAVVTIGSTEQHGTNLPLSTDTLIAERFAQKAAQELDAYLTPTIPIGQSEAWLEYPGTLSFSTETMKSIIVDIVDSLVTTGFTTIIFISIHGANVVAYQGFPEELQEQYSGIRIFTAGYPFWVRENWAEIWRKACEEAGIPQVYHADEGETSLILSQWPELVGPNPTDCPLPEDTWPADKSKRELYPSGSMGYPSKATKEKGDRLWAGLLRLALEDLKAQMAAGDRRPRGLSPDEVGGPS
jgi:creatinine amidohydrolase